MKMKKKEMERERKEREALIKQQDLAYQESLRIDQKKERDKAESAEVVEVVEERVMLKEQNERVERMKCRYMSEIEALGNGDVPIGFKFGDGRKTSFNFSSNCNIHVS